MCSSENTGLLQCGESWYTSQCESKRKVTPQVVKLLHMPYFQSQTGGSEAGSLKVLISQVSQERIMGSVASFLVVSLHTKPNSLFFIKPVPIHRGRGELSEIQVDFNI